MSQWFNKIWMRLTESVRTGNARDAQFSRLLNIILLALFGLAFTVEVQYRLRGGVVDTREVGVWFTLAILGVAYALNHRGYLLFATITVLGLFIIVTFTWAILLHFQGIDDLTILHYLIIAVVISEMFLSTRGYLI